MRTQLTITDKNHPISVLFSFGLLLFTLNGQAQKYIFEKLGEPLHSPTAAIRMVTTGKNPMAWVSVESPDLYDIIGIDIKSGKTVKLNLEKYGRGHFRMHRSADGNVYIFYGHPSHFLKYDVSNCKLTDLGEAASGSYTLREGIGPDDKMWVGSYPETELSWVDPKTDKIGNFGRISTDVKEKYIIDVVIADDKTVYCAVGLNHAELWSVNPASGEKKQILPDDLMHQQGVVTLQLGEDGKVYGSGQGRFWRCKTNGVDFIDKMPSQRRKPDINTYNGERFTSMNAESELVAQTAKGLQRRIPTDFIMPNKQIYNLGSVYDGKIYGGGASGRATLFTYDMGSGELKDLGVHGAGTVQIYDMLGYRRGIFFTTYTLGGIDLYDPVSQKITPIAQLASEKYQQERLMQLSLGSDNMIYSGSIPIKGILGGALVRVNPNDLSVKVWRNIVPEQSIISVVPVPVTNEIFFTSNIRGGSSSIPTQKEAVVGFWDIKSERVSWTGKPLPETDSYGQAALGKDGLIYGVTGKKYYIIDPKTRQVMKVGNLPVNILRNYAFHDAAAGPGGLIYGLGDDAIFAIDPKTKNAIILARHESIKTAQGILVTDDGTIYFGSGASLWRARPTK